FGGAAPPPPGDWSGIPHEVLSSGRPVLSGALAWFDCGAVATHSVGDHALVLGRVGDFRAGGGNPLVWWRREAWTIA
ncbi:MAG: flavin reductase, partial [Candidatus Dormibacteraceae bacterium]